MNIRYLVEIATDYSGSDRYICSSLRTAFQCAKVHTVINHLSALIGDLPDSYTGPSDLCNPKNWDMGIQYGQRLLIYMDNGKIIGTKDVKV